MATANPTQAKRRKISPTRSLDRLIILPALTQKNVNKIIAENIAAAGASFGYRNLYVV